MKKYFAEFAEFIKNKGFEEEFEAFLRDDTRNNSQILNKSEKEICEAIDEKNVYSKIMGGKNEIDSVIRRNIVILFAKMERVVQSKVAEGNFSSSTDYILKTSPTQIFDSANELADGCLVNPKIKKYLIARFQEFVKEREAPKVAEIKQPLKNQSKKRLKK